MSSSFSTASPSPSDPWSRSTWSIPASVVTGGQTLRVAIIGGGIAGLALGQLLCDSLNVEFTVYERSPDAIDNLTGYRIMLSAFVLRKLQSQLRPETWAKVVASIGFQPQEGQDQTYMKYDGQQLFKNKDDKFLEQFSVSRWLLREALLHKSQSFLITGKSYQRFEELSDGSIRLFFYDGTSAECDLLVGADGVGSNVRRQICPNTGTMESGVAVIYFKIPYTQYTQELLPTQSGAMVLCERNQNIYLHAWVNPKKQFATNFDENDISATESFIMVGYGSPVNQFSDRHKPPSELSPSELKAEILTRVNSKPGFDPVLRKLAQLCLLNTSYVHVVKETGSIKNWTTRSVTLIGDAVFNITTILGKGANCALLDAIDLANTLNKPSVSSTLWRKRDLRQTANENVKRRMRERQRSALVDSILYMGSGKIKEFCKKRGLKIAFDWIHDPQAAFFHESKPEEKVEKW